MSERFEYVREKDHVVLSCIRNGHDDVQQIRSETTLTWREVDYSIEKLADQGLIDVEKQEGYVTRIVDGQKRTFQAPRSVDLTRQGRQYFAEHQQDLGQYEDLSRDELIERIHELEDRVDRLENGFKAFRQQVKRQLES